MHSYTWAQPAPWGLETPLFSLLGFHHSTSFLAFNVNSVDIYQVNSLTMYSKVNQTVLQSFKMLPKVTFKPMFQRTDRLKRIDPLRISDKRTSDLSLARGAPKTNYTRMNERVNGSMWEGLFIRPEFSWVGCTVGPDLPSKRRVGWSERKDKESFVVLPISPLPPHHHLLCHT